MLNIPHVSIATQVPYLFLTYPGAQSQPGKQFIVQGVGVAIPRILLEHVCSHVLSHIFGTWFTPQVIGSTNFVCIC